MVQLRELSELEVQGELNLAHTDSGNRTHKVSGLAYSGPW